MLPERFQYLDPDHLSLRYNIGATGSTVTSSNKEDLAYGSSAISYELDVGGAWTSGSQYRSTSGASNQYGTWGTITGTVSVALGGTFDLSLAGHAKADIWNIDSEGIRQVLTNADFGSTLIWNGIVGVEAFDAGGQQIALPNDFEIGLIGQRSGFNYWNAAVHPNHPAVPDGGHVTLFAALAGLGLIVRQRRGLRAARSAA